MKSKKLISFLCAAAMTASTFASLAVTASAAATPAWSFDGSSTDGWSGSVTPTVATDEGSTDSYLDFLAGTSTKCNDVTFALPAAAQLSDDYVLEYDAFIHTSNGMGRLAQYTQLAFTGANPVQDSQNYGGTYAEEAASAFDLVDNKCDDHTTWNASDENGWGYVGDIVSSITNRIELMGNMVINNDGANAPSMNDGNAQIGDSKWVRVRNEVKDGKAKVTIADSNGTIVDGEEFAVSATKLTQIKMTFGRADTTHFITTTPANIKLDNIKVYDGIAGTPAFSTSDLRKSPIVATPIPAPEKVAGPAPKFYAPESAENVYTANFNSEAVKTLASVETTAQDPVQVTNGMKVQVGNRPEGADAKTYASIVKVADGDNALRLAADNFSTNGRGPVVSLDNNIDLSDMTSGSAVMSFAVYLSKTDTNGIERLFLFDNTTNVDGNGCARDVVAVITTEDIQNEDESYKYTAGEANIGIHVEPEQWHTIAVVATAGDSPVRLFVDGKYEADGALSPALKLDMVGTGEGNKTAVTHLPMIGIENTKAYNKDSGEGGTVYSTALIDNVLTYFVQGDLRAKNLPQTDGEEPTPAPATPEPIAKVNMTVTEDGETATVKMTSDIDTEADLIKASYDAGGKLVNVDVKPVTLVAGTELTETVANTVKGDKIMLWNSVKKMAPLAASYTITQGAAQATAAPVVTPTPEVTEAPSEAPTEAPSTEPSTAPSTAPSTEPSTAPSTAPSTEPSTAPSTAPSTEPSTAPSTAPSTEPSTEPTAAPTPEPVVPYAAGTLTYDEDGDTAMFVGKGSVDNISITNGDAAKGNSTKVERVTSTVNNYRRANAIKFPNGFQATGNVKITFDYLVNGRMSDIYIVGEDKDMGGAKSGAEILSKNILGLVTNKDNIAINSGSDAATANLNVMAGWAHVEAVVNTTAKTTSLKIYNYKANNNYANETPVFTNDALAFKDNTITGVAGLYIAGTNGMDACFDNICMTPDEGYVTPIKVTTEGATVDKPFVKAADVITITPTVAEGKKVTAVKVNGTAIQTTTVGEGDEAQQVYQYTVKAEDTAVAVTAEFARADVTEVTIASTNANVQKGYTGTYAATVKAGTVTLTGDDAKVTWGVKAAEGAGAATACTATISNEGVLTVPADHAEGKIVVTATITKDVTAAAGDTNTVVGTFDVTVIGEPVYQVVADSEMTHGTVSFKVGENAATSVKQSETLEIVPAPAAGYSTSKVEYILTSALTGETPVWSEVTAAEGKYTVAGTALTGNITVKVTYAAIEYNVVNGFTEANGNSLAIKVGDTAVTKATVGQDVVVVPTIAQGYKLKTLTYTEDGEGKTPVSIIGNTFKMPAANVTINAEFEAFNGVYYKEDFEGETHTFTTSHTDNIVVMTDADTVPAGAKNATKFLNIVPRNGGEVNIKSPSLNISDTVKFSADIRLDAGTKDKNEAFALIGENNSTTWLSSAKQILSITCLDTGNGYGKLQINDADVTYTMKDRTYGSGKGLTDAKYQSTGWLKVEATINFSTKKVNLKLSTIETTPATIVDQEYDFKNDAATSLEQIFMQASKSYGSASIDNISITAPWYTAE